MNLNNKICFFELQILQHWFKSRSKTPITSSAKVSHYTAHHIPWISHSQCVMWPHAAIVNEPLQTRQTHMMREKCSKIIWMHKDEHRTWLRRKDVLFQMRAAAARCGRVARRCLSSAGALWGCGFKTGCHEAGSTENTAPNFQPTFK